MTLRLKALRSAVRRFVHDDGGQDLIEYALLAAFISVVGILAWTNIENGIGSAYTGWDDGIKTLSTCTPDPIALGGECSPS